MTISLVTSEVEEGVALELLDVYRRLSGAEPTLGDTRAATDGARRLLLVGLSPAQLEAFWRQRLCDFLPAAVPDVAFLVQPAALAEAPHWRPVTSTPRPSRTLHPRLIDTLRVSGGAVAWTMGAALMLQRTAEASAAGCEPYIPPQLSDLVGRVRQACWKLPPV